MDETLVVLIKLVLLAGHIIEEWFVGLILPIYKKKEEISNSDNYWK